MNNIKFDKHDVPSSAFGIIYKRMRDRTLLKLRHAIKVMQAAKFLKIDLLIIECWKLFNEPDVREKVAFDIYWSAGRFSELEELRTVMLTRIRFYFLPMVGTTRFLKMNLDQLNSFIKLDTIGVNSEVEIFYVAVRWIRHNPTDRLPHMKEIMNLVRISFISMTTLKTIQENLVSEDFENICSADYVAQQLSKDSDIKYVLNVAVSYIKHRKQTETEGEANGTTIPKAYTKPLLWIYNPKCPYHLSKLIYPYKHNFTYSDFMDFITTINLDWLGAKPEVDVVQKVDPDGFLKQVIDTKGA